MNYIQSVETHLSDCNGTQTNNHLDNFSKILLQAKKKTFMHKDLRFSILLKR